MEELVEKYRAQTAQSKPGSGESNLKEALDEIGIAEPGNAGEAELKLQVLLEEGVDGIIGPENYPKMVMKAYVRRLMFNF